MFELCEEVPPPVASAASSLGWLCFKSVAGLTNKLLRDDTFEHLLFVASRGQPSYWHVRPSYHVDTSLVAHELLLRAITLLEVAHLHGALVTLELPEGHLARASHTVQKRIQTFLPFSAVAAGCQWATRPADAFQASRAFHSNSIRIMHVDTPCMCHQQCSSRTTSQFQTQTGAIPAHLATSLVRELLGSNLATLDETWIDPFQWMQSLPTRSSIKLRFIPDGAGVFSSAEWPVPFVEDVFKPLRGQLFEILAAYKTPLLMSDLSALASQDDLLPTPCKNQMLQCMQNWLLSMNLDCDPIVSAGQPFRLNILESLAKVSQDPDLHLVQELQSGVSLGIDTPISNSHCWPQKTLELQDKHNHEATFSDLIACESNWSSADADPDLTCSLIAKELEAGFIQEIAGGWDEVVSTWGERRAVGKLAIAHHPTRKPRLVLDSTVCGLNPKSAAAISEKTSNPHLSNLKDCMASGLSTSQMFLTLDVKAAHKRIRVRHADQGLLLFSFQGKWFRYAVTHFGGTFSAFYWTRLSGLIHRLLHKLVFIRHSSLHYVDDYIFILEQASAPMLASFILAMCETLQIPLSWDKIKFGTAAQWIGWSLSTATNLVSTPDEKRGRIAALLQQAATQTKVKRKLLEQLAGTLVWLSEQHWEFRWFLGPIYSWLRKPGIQLVRLSRQEIAHVLDNLSPSFCLQQLLPKPFVPQGSTLQRLGKFATGNSTLGPFKTRCFDLNYAWATFLNCRSCNVSLTPEDRQHLSALRLILQEIQPKDLLGDFPRIILEGGADAFAHKDVAGLGAWLSVSSTKTVWCSFQCARKDLPPWLLWDNLQSGIMAFECLAQIALLAMLWIHTQMPAFYSVASLLDNQAAEAAIATGFHQNEALSVCLRLLQRFVNLTRSSLVPSRVASSDNSRADNLSRGFTSHEEPSNQSPLTFQQLCSAFGSFSLEPRCHAKLGVPASEASHARGGTCE